MASLLQKPLSGMIPARERATINMETKVIGRLFRRPPMSFMYFDSLTCNSQPAHMKSPALKRAWLMRWKNAPVNPKTKFDEVERPAMPNPSIMYPIWETVEYARTFFSSFRTIACEAAKNAVKPPIKATVKKKGYVS